MADLRIDEGLLQEARASLGVIASQFAAATQRRDASSGIWGSQEVRDAMGAFVDDWGRHRRLLGEDLETFAGKVEGIVKGFGDTEAELADTFRRPGAGGAAPDGAAR